jgi:hypothetical protein
MVRRCDFDWFRVLEQEYLRRVGQYCTRSSAAQQPGWSGLPRDPSEMQRLFAAFLEGATAEEIVEQYPSLQLADVYSVIGYDLQ